MRVYIAIHEWEDFNTREQTYCICGIFDSNIKANERLKEVSAKFGFLNNDKYFIEENNIQ